MSKGKYFLAILIGLGIGIAYKEIEIRNRKSSNECGVYKGSSKKLSPLVANYFFEQNGEEERKVNRRITALGNPRLESVLKEGERYCFVLKESMLPWEETIVDSLRRE